MRLSKCDIALCSIARSTAVDVLGGPGRQPLGNAAIAEATSVYSCSSTIEGSPSTDLRMKAKDMALGFVAKNSFFCKSVFRRALKSSAEKFQLLAIKDSAKLRAKRASAST